MDIAKVHIADSNPKINKKLSKDRQLDELKRLVDALEHAKSLGRQSVPIDSLLSALREIGGEP